MEQIKLFNRFCENNRYTGTLKFNTIFGELHIQIRTHNIIVQYVTTLNEFENNTYGILEKLQEKMIVTKMKKEGISLNL